MSLSPVDPGPERRLPPRPSLEYLKSEAKRRLRDARPGAKLAQVQHQLAREYGFANWRDLKANVERAGDTSGAAEAQAAIGDWRGALPGSNRIALHVRRGQGGLEVTLDTPDLGMFGLAAEDVAIEAGRLSFTLPGPMLQPSQQGLYEAGWDPDGDAWRGDWTSHGIAVPLDFTRGVYPPAPILEGLDGFWDGRLETQTGPIRLSVRVRTDRHGTFAWLDSPDTHLLGRPAASIRREGREVTVAMRTVTLSGTLTEDGQSIEGRFTKKDTVLPLVLRRRARGAAPPLPRRAPPVDLPRAVLAKYVGRYATEVGTFLHISLDADRLRASFAFAAPHPDGPEAADRPAESPRLDLLASSPTRFFWRVMDATAEFEWAPDGRVTGVTVRQNGRASHARRLD